MSQYSPYVCMQTNSKCYKNTTKFVPIGILWHSTGANNPNLKRYVQPTNGSANYDADIKKLGKNTAGNDWNHTQTNAGVNAWIGKFADGTVGTVQTMPWDYAPWGCGTGSKGSCNQTKMNGKYYGWIQFEICEDALTDKAYAQQVYDEAVALTAYLCREYHISPNGTFIIKGVEIPTITCHNDANKLGFATAHADINHWFPKILGKNMDDVRRDVGAALGEAPAEEAPAAAEIESEIDSLPTTEYKVQITAQQYLNVRVEPNMNSKIVTMVKRDEVYTIIKEENGWGYLKSGAGWINLTYTKKI